MSTNRTVRARVNPLPWYMQTENYQQGTSTMAKATEGPKVDLTLSVEHNRVDVHVLQNRKV